MKIECIWKKKKLFLGVVCGKENLRAVRVRGGRGHL